MGLRPYAFPWMMCHASNEPSERLLTTNAAVPSPTAALRNARNESDWQSEHTGSLVRIAFGTKGYSGEANRVSLVRSLDAIAPLASAHGRGLAAAVDRARRG